MEQISDNSLGTSNVKKEIVGEEKQPKDPFLDLKEAMDQLDNKARSSIPESDDDEPIPTLGQMMRVKET